MVRHGFVPSDPMFHLRRFAHISDTCVNCGQCEENCPSEIPLALFSHAIRTEEDKFFEPKLGKAGYTN
jgi:formate dehydrogenase subunit beta